MQGASPQVARRYFGTDGIRGPYAGPVVCERFFERLGEAVAGWARARGAPAEIRMGRDTRSSGESLVAAFAGGFSRGGGRALSLGILPTPAVSRACSDAGVLGAAVTASHNPSSDNGIKFFHADGSKLSDADEASIEALLAKVPEGKDPFPAVETASGLEAYVEAASRLLAPRALEGWKVVLDTAHGATFATSPRVFRAFGAQVTCIGSEPDGANINDGVGSEHPELLAQATVRNGARIGIAHDGDGDRCVLCDEKGSVLDGDEVLAVLATDALREGSLPRGILVATVQSNLGLDQAVAAAGGRVVRTPVGDRYVAEAMRATGAMLGGESSGHVICRDVSPTGDGLAAALRVAAVMVRTGRPLSELRRALVRAPQRVAALRVREKRPLEGLKTLAAEMAALERELGAAGRILVRYSGTEPKLRLLVEGPSEACVRDGIDRLTAAACADLEVETGSAH